MDLATLRQAGEAASRPTTERDDGVPRRSRSRVVDILVIAAFPFVLTAFNNTWIFVKPLFIDRWIYSGLHMHLGALASAFWYTYYVSREPWLLLGWAAHRLFAPESALYVLHFFVFYVAAFSLYCGVTTIFKSRLAALTATMLLATQSEFLTAAGWDYVDGFYTASLLFSLAALGATALSARWRLAAALWGAGTAVVVSLYPLLGVLFPAQLIAFVVLNRRDRRPLPATAAYFVIGAAACVLLTCCFTRLAGAPFWYFAGQLSMLGRVAANRPEWYRPPSEWIGTASYLIVPVATCVASFVMLTKRLDDALRAVCLANIAAFASYILLEADHFIVLQISDKVNALLPFAFFMIGGMISMTVRNVPASIGRILSAGAAIVAIAPWILSGIGAIKPHTEFFSGLPYELAWISIGVAILVLPAIQPVWRFALEIAFFAAIGFGNADATVMSFPADPYFRQATLAVFDATKAVGEYNPRATARFWFNVTDRYASLERDVNSTYLGAYTKINENFPSLTNDDGSVSRILPGDRVIILTSTGNPIHEADAALAGSHVTLEQRAFVTITRPGVNFSFLVGDARFVVPERSRQLRVPHVPVDVRIRPRAWDYGAVIPLPPYLGNGDTKKSVIELEVDAAAGKPWVGVLSRDGKNFVERRPIDVSLGRQTVYFVDVDLADAQAIVVENGPDAIASKVHVVSATVLIPASSTK